MKKNDTAEAAEKKLIWKMKDLPTAGAVASLVETKVITPEEARGILFKEEAKQSDEVEALKEMVDTLQDMVKTLLARRDNVVNLPYTRVVEVPQGLDPYWQKYWTATKPFTSPNGNNTIYTLSI